MKRFLKLIIDNNKLQNTKYSNQESNNLTYGSYKIIRQEAEWFDK